MGHTISHIGLTQMLLGHIYLLLLYYRFLFLFGVKHLWLDLRGWLICLRIHRWISLRLFQLTYSYYSGGFRLLLINNRKVPSGIYYVFKLLALGYWQMGILGIHQLLLINFTYRRFNGCCILCTLMTILILRSL